MSTPDTPAKPDKVETPITEPPLEPEETPIVVHDSEHADAVSPPAEADTTAGDEGIDDIEADDYEKAAQPDR